MTDDESRFDGAAMAELVTVLTGDSDAARTARIRAMSDRELERAYALLSDERYLVNVSALPLLEAEIKRRNLPMSRRQ